MALNENNSNEELIAGAMVIQIGLAMDTCLLAIEYRITVKVLIKQPQTPWPYVGPTNPQSHCCDIVYSTLSLSFFPFMFIGVRRLISI